MEAFDSERKTIMNNDYLDDDYLIPEVNTKKTTHTIDLK